MATVELNPGDYFSVEWVNEEGLTCSVALYFDHLEGNYPTTKILACREP